VACPPTPRPLTAPPEVTRCRGLFPGSQTPMASSHIERYGLSPLVRFGLWRAYVAVMEGRLSARARAICLRCPTLRCATRAFRASARRGSRPGTPLDPPRRRGRPDGAPATIAAAALASATTVAANQLRRSRPPGALPSRSSHPSHALTLAGPTNGVRPPHERLRAHLRPIPPTPPKVILLGPLSGRPGTLPARSWALPPTARPASAIGPGVGPVTYP
jgi:hypothetical protein